MQADILKGEDSANPVQDIVKESSGPLKAAEKARIIKALPPDILPAVAAADKALEADDLQVLPNVAPYQALKARFYAKEWTVHETNTSNRPLKRC